MILIKPIESVTKIEQVRQAILEMIFAGSLLAGQRLVEARLAAHLGVSQATINAALQDLHNQGIVIKLLNRSTTVRRYTPQDIDQLFSVRMALEPAAAAAASLKPQKLHELWRHVDAMRAAAHNKDLPGFCLADYSFHQHLYRLTGNTFLIQACQAIAAAPFAYILCNRPAELPTNYAALAEDHAEIIAALKDGPARAESFTRIQVERWRLHSVHALESLHETGVAHAAR